MDTMLAATTKTNLPLLKKSYSLTPIYQKPSTTETKSPGTDWCNKFNQLWTRTDWLFSFLRSPEDYYRQPIKLRLPLLFYLGHLPCFAWFQFGHIDGIHHEIDRLFDELFQRGIDPDVQTGVVHHSHSSRYSNDENGELQYWRTFSLQSVVDYKNKVRGEILRVLVSGNLDFQDLSILNVLNVALEHEMMHQETLMYLYAQLPSEALQSHSVNPTNLSLEPVNSPLSENPWISIPAGPTTLGKSYPTHVTNYSFGWDNEFPSEPTYVSSFELQSHPIRIGDFLEFLVDKGYENPQWWNKDVFQWLQESNISHPASWNFDESSSSYRVNFIFQRDIPIGHVFDHPVIVSQVEAKAYCRWLSHRTGKTIDLPTEAEWIHAMWDSSMPLIDSNGNVNFRHFHTLPIKSSLEKKLQWQGSAFEWTSSRFRPFRGYQGDLPSYPGYSSDFFDDHHYVILGGSFVTDSTLIRRTFRNWFQSNYRYVFATFRCVKRTGHTDFPLTEIDRQTIIRSLSNENHRAISSQYFYDAHGSAIYEQITQLNEYYLYNQELKLLKQRSVDMKKTIMESRPSSSTIHFIELGCGDGSKVETWLRPWVESVDQTPVVYHPVDISQHAIDSLVNRLKQTFGERIVRDHVKPICSTFDEMYSKIDMKSCGMKVLMLLGSTVGNFSSFDDKQVKYSDQSPVMKLMRSIRSNLNINDWFLCGFDLCKNLPTMVSAYSDSQGVTAAFNYNLLHRLNRELNFNFDVEHFQHYALFNPLLRRMESWLITQKQQTISDQHGFTVDLQPFEAIHTEISTKYTRNDIELLMKLNSFRIVQCYQIDQHHLPYALYMAQAI